MFHVQYEDLGQLCNDPRARAAVLADMDAIGKEAEALHKMNLMFIFSFKQTFRQLIFYPNNVFAAERF